MFMETASAFCSNRCAFAFHLVPTRASSMTLHSVGCDGKGHVCAEECFHALNTNGFAACMMEDATDHDVENCVAVAGLRGHAALLLHVLMQ